MPRQLQILSPKEINQLPDFQSNPPPSITGTCTKCGKCCLDLKCPALNKNNNHCRVHTCRPVGCRIWPGTQVEIDRIGCPGFHQTGL